MKNYFLTILFGILLLVACTPTTTSTPVAILPTDIPTDIPTRIPTSTPLPQGNTIIVTSTSDSGPGTLRQALQDAQPYDTITFDPAIFPPDAPVTIYVMTELPHIQQSNLTLDASDAGVILDGSQIPGDWVAGLQIVSSEANTIMGLQISNFPGPGIAISGDAKHNVIGGDRSLGAGPFGQGNLFSHNAHGIDLSTSGTSLNTITGNLLGTDAADTVALSNQTGVWITEGAHGNIVGPDNIIANNGGCGVVVDGADSLGNTLTQNSIHDNGGIGICLFSGGNATLGAPIILDFDITGGLITGATCANCTVEIFSDSGDEGAAYEGQAVADRDGVFTFNKGVAFTNANVTLTTTDADGNTSGFSRSPGGTTRVLILQEGNRLPKFQLTARPSNELVDNRTGISFGGLSQLDNWEGTLDEAIDFGVKRVDMGLYEIEPPIDWSTGSEFNIPANADRFVDGLAKNGIAMNLLLHFWDKEGHANGETLSTPRFKTDQQIQDFLDYVRFVVGHFKGRIQYYTIWSEPDNCGPPPIKCVLPNDYINLSRQVIPIIRQEDPQAEVGLAPNVLYFARPYLFTILKSDVISMFDMIEWHGIYDVAPNIGFYGNYYYEYPSIIQEIKQTASTHGFNGEYWGTEITWCSEEFPWCKPADQPWGQQKTDLLAAKYYARGIVLEHGMDLAVGIGGWQTTAPWSYPTIRNLNTVMAGVKPTNLSVDIESEATNIMSYGFILPNGDKLFALWTHGTAIEYDPGINTTLTFKKLSAGNVAGIDVLNGFEQELIAETDGGDLVIRNLLVKDYPIIIKFIDTTP